VNLSSSQSGHRSFQSSEKDHMGSSHSSSSKKSMKQTQRGSAWFASISSLANVTSWDLANSKENSSRYADQQYGEDHQKKHKKFAFRVLGNVSLSSGASFSGTSNHLLERRKQDLTID
jgi:hypothetical protein